MHGSRGPPKGPWWGPGATAQRWSRRQCPWKVWDFTCFEVLWRALLDLYQHPINMYINDQKDTNYAGKKYKNDKIGEVNAGIRNKLLVLNV